MSIVEAVERVAVGGSAVVAVDVIVVGIVAIAGLFMLSQELRRVAPVSPLAPLPVLICVPYNTRPLSPSFGVKGKTLKMLLAL